MHQNCILVSCLAILFAKFHQRSSKHPRPSLPATVFPQLAARRPDSTMHSLDEPTPHRRCEEKMWIPLLGCLGKPAKTFMVCKFALQSLRQDSVGEDLWEKLQHHYWAVPQAPLCTHPPEPSSPTRVRFLGLGIVSATWAEVRCDEDPDLRTQHGLP